MVETPLHKNVHHVQVESGSPGDARKRAKVNPQPLSRAHSLKDAPSESAVRHMAGSAQTTVQEVMQFLMRPFWGSS